MVTTVLLIKAHLINGAFYLIKTKEFYTVGEKV